MITYFTWSEFDKSVEQIANKCRFKEFSGIYGVPRGGLCLAVALSHKLKIELISEPIKNSLLVDDVYETGITLTTFKNIEGAETLQEFVNKLERPRRILMMVKAGPATDAVIDNISGYLEEGDLLIDGGNSLFKDTE